jgi:pimeloyl-ACP methyl ester carboxylesterase
MLTVPLNYSDPTGATIKIAVSRIKHTSSAAKYQGVILTNPGGPGGSGLDLNTFLIAQLKAEGSAADKAAVADYDWIGFDPRGVGSSVPAITCAPYYFSGDRENYNPRTKQILNYWLHRSARYDQRCATHSAAQSALLDNMTTVDTARDMDSIRQALGQSQISYYGFSYGTYLGQVYSTLFPSHVRRLIMDSNVDPRKVWYQANLDQDIAFNRNIKIWFGWLAQHHSFYHLGRTEKTVENPLLRGKGPAVQAPHPGAGRPGRMDRRFPGARLLRGDLAAVWQRVRELGPHAQQEGRRRAREPLPGGGHARRRQRIRRLQRGAVHGRAVAD